MLLRLEGEAGLWRPRLGGGRGVAVGAEILDVGRLVGAGWNVVLGQVGHDEERLAELFVGGAALVLALLDDLLEMRDVGHQLGGFCLVLLRLGLADLLAQRIAGRLRIFQPGDDSLARIVQRDQRGGGKGHVLARVEQTLRGVGVGPDPVDVEHDESPWKEGSFWASGGGMASGGGEATRREEWVALPFAVSWQRVFRGHGKSSGGPVARLGGCREDGAREARAPRGMFYEAHTPRGRQDFGVGVSHGHSCSLALSPNLVGGRPPRLPVQPTPSVVRARPCRLDEGRIRGRGGAWIDLCGASGEGWRCWGLGRFLPLRSGGRWRPRDA